MFVRSYSIRQWFGFFLYKAIWIESFQWSKEEFQNILFSKLTTNLADKTHQDQTSPYLLRLRIRQLLSITDTVTSRCYYANM